MFMFLSLKSPNGLPRVDARAWLLSPALILGHFGFVVIISKNNKIITVTIITR